MKTLLLTKFYACIGIAILGVRMAFEFLSPIEIVYFFVSVLLISLVGTFIHKFFEKQSEKTGKNGEDNFGFAIKMIVTTILASFGLYMLISYIASGGHFSIGFDILFYVILIPCTVLFALWMYFKIEEQEYNKKLEELKQKTMQDTISHT